MIFTGYRQSCPTSVSTVTSLSSVPSAFTVCVLDVHLTPSRLRRSCIHSWRQVSTSTIPFLPVHQSRQTWCKDCQMPPLTSSAALARLTEVCRSFCTPSYQMYQNGSGTSLVSWVWLPTQSSASVPYQLLLAGLRRTNKTTSSLSQPPSSCHTALSIQHLYGWLTVWNSLRTIYVTRTLAETASVVLWKHFHFRNTSTLAH